MSLQQENTLSILNKVLKQTPKLRKGGTQAIYYCVKCHHYKRKLEINLVTGQYHCWICNFAGKSIKSILRNLNAPKEYYNKVVEERKACSDETLNALFDTQKKEHIINVLPNDFQSLTEYNKSIEYTHAMHYLKKRNVTEYDIYRYNIGYCTEGKYKNRVIIPSYDIDGNLNFFSGRDFFGTSWLKYVNCEFNKNIIGFELTVDFDNPIILVESPFNAITIKRNTIPLFGKTVSKKLYTRMMEKRTKDVYICLDSDAGKDAIRIAERLIKLGITPYIVDLDGGKDPNEIGYDATWKCINKAKLVDFSYLMNIKLNI
jgi:DNA primase